MKPGHVVSMRVSPRNCMAVVDLLRTADVPLEGMSFASAVSRALDLTLSGLIKAGHLPERSGFEFSNMMEPFGLGVNTGKARSAQSDRVAGMFEQPPAVEDLTQDSTQITKEQAKQGLRALLDSYDGVDAGEWKEDDRALYDTYMGVLYG